MKRKCPSCGEIAVVLVVFRNDDDEYNANESILECESCYSVANIVAWDANEDRIHAGFDIIMPEDFGALLVIHLTRNCDESWDWVNTHKPYEKHEQTLNLN
jgi:hypothetical protein